MSTQFEAFGWGEAMLRYAPTTASPFDGETKPSSASLWLRTVGGDELNVMVALARLGRSCGWSSVLPESRTGKVPVMCAEDAGVDASRVVAAPGALMGCFHVLPDERRVHYERAGSAFAKADEAALLACVGGATCAWRHATGITPLLSAAARAAWLKDLEGLAGTKVFLDLNWRPALGTLEDLWHAAVAKALGDEACAVDTLVVSLTQLRLVAKLVGVADVPEAMSVFEQRDGHSALGRGGAAAGAVVPETDACWPTLLADARATLAATYAGAKALKLACCFKTRDAATGLQKRWSVLASATGLATTVDCPVLHTPKDECGGGSAWAAGYVDARLDGLADAEALRRADLLAALCQESQGDHSDVPRAALEAYERRYAGEPTSPRLVPCPSLGAGAAPPPPPVAAAAPASNAALDGALATVARGKVVAILRAKNADAAIARGVELANLGCSALEVTLDSVEFERVLSTLVARVGDFCCVGVGTVQDAADVPRVAALGAKFALSPFNPPGMIEACLKYNVLPVPAAFTPQEIRACWNAGAKLIKIFPAQLWTPAALKDLRSVGDFKHVSFLPSGGITPDNAAAWLDAGACACGMGSKLVGAAVRADPSDAAALAAAEDDWQKNGLPKATKLFASLA